MTFTEHGDNFLTAELGKHLRLRTGRFHDDDFGFGAVIRDGEVLGTDAVDHRTPVGIGRRC